jgi:hypothetical protein
MHKSADKKINVLIAYPYTSKGAIQQFVDHGDNIRFLLDSGAFTAWKTGKEVKLDDYCKFVESLPVKPWRYFTLDVIGNAEATFKNYETMLKRGFKPVPIFTRGEKVDMIDEYYKTAEVVGVGGLVGTAGNKGFVNGLMKRIGTRRCHWLGFTSLPFLKHYHPYMCDSSSWKSSRRYGDVALYTGDGKFTTLRKVTFSKPPPLDVINKLAAYGFDAKDLAQTHEWHGGYTLSSFISTCSWVLYQADIRKFLGTELFLAAAGDADIKIIMNCAQHLRKIGKL